uniref:Uncharacterized protein n=1 Tax=Oryza punctata TaxID=4537 RepID=A0A0E0JY16_ORYPU
MTSATSGWTRLPPLRRRRHRWHRILHGKGRYRGADPAASGARVVGVREVLHGGQGGGSGDGCLDDYDGQAPSTRSPLPDPVGRGSGPPSDRGSAQVWASACGNNGNRGSHGDICSKLPPSPTQLNDGNR